MARGAVVDMVLLRRRTAAVRGRSVRHAAYSIKTKWEPEGAKGAFKCGVLGLAWQFGKVRFSRASGT